MARLDFTTRTGRAFVRGTDKTITFRSTDKNGNPVDLTGATFTAEVRALPGSGSPVICEPNVYILDASDGTWAMQWTAANSLAILPATEVESATVHYAITRDLVGLTTPIFHGLIEVIPTAVVS